MKSREQKITARYPVFKPVSLPDFQIGTDISGFIGSRVEETEARINRKYRNSRRSL
jgi:hypothetical protein